MKTRLLIVAALVVGLTTLVMNLSDEEESHGNNAN
jgi:hypothetical protein